MNTADIENYLRETYPSCPLTKLLEGGMSYAYEIAGRIIRIPKTQYAERGYETEFAILQYLHKTVNCTLLPEVRIIRKPFFHTSHDKIPGYYWNEKDYLALDINRRDAFAEDCAVFFSQLHSSDVSKIKVELQGLHRIDNNMELYLSEYFTLKDRDQILHFTEPLYSLGDTVLVHRDFYQDNFLHDGNYRLKCVLDFGNSGLYNYMFDFKSIASWEEGMHDLFQRIASRYSRITGRIIDLDTVHRIDIHNYISFLVYFVKNKDIKDEKIGATAHLQEHVAHIKEKMKRYV